MKTFTCSVCRELVFFENVRCLRCGHALAYLPDHAVMSALGEANGEAAPAGEFEALAPIANGARYRLCRNGVEHQACNWALPAGDGGAFCRACRLNDVIPNLADERTREAWRHIERAKRRLFATLFELRLPIESIAENPQGGLAFRFLRGETGGGEKVVTGHRGGVITLDVAEADAPFREKVRESMGEAYRTLLGHFRHEIGHYYWDRLVARAEQGGQPPDTGELESFRAIFGDERADYAQAVARHYEGGPPADWPLRFVSAYASAHPWEDWAETWAHYLHMVDTLDTARSYGLAMRVQTTASGPSARRLVVSTRGLDFDDFDDLISAWFPLTIALSSLNRSMGLPDLYPFALSAEAVKKLAFVHDVVERAVAGRAAGDSDERDRRPEPQVPVEPGPRRSMSP